MSDRLSKYRPHSPTNLIAGLGLLVASTVSHHSLAESEEGGSEETGMLSQVRDEVQLRLNQQSYRYSPDSPSPTSTLPCPLPEEQGLPIIQGNRLFANLISCQAYLLAWGYSSEERRVCAKLLDGNGDEYKQCGLTLKETPSDLFPIAQKAAREDGYDIKILEGYRAPERSEAKFQKLKAQGRNYRQKWVARGGQSYHNAGAAVDVVLVDKDGTWLTRNWHSEPENKPAALIEHERKLEAYMNYAGFIRYEAEPWHFEVGSNTWIAAMNDLGIPLDKPYKRKQLKKAK